MSVDALQGVSITVAPNGGRRTKADHPAIPLTPEELARTARDCLEAGAAMIHVHVRKADGSHLLDAEAYRAAITAIRKAVGNRLVIQMTSEALGIYSPAEQIAVVKSVRPQAASLALRELVPDEAHEAAFADLLSWAARQEVMPQIILYSPEEAVRLADMRRRGLLSRDDIPVLYVLGRYTPGQTSLPRDLLTFLAPEMPVFAHWSVCAFGRHEAACVTAAALAGGHVRVGFENNLRLPDGTPSGSNADLVRAVTAVLRPLSIPLIDGPALADMLSRIGAAGMHRD
ncbi:3-keto-5-aminohexanoate cleavage protein [Sinorhizobium medicae]|uniref:3-keto-5-aminohexanoate cleavage protein n=1 Tax=Sinorhizobium medicae TaxID=110321 RepID=UPI000FDA8475|nr:3-keto-5-aminohexanoate cleavage protein [Sinorhizobium medicae]MDX0541749.1 3-keto-5-aminohexanoate cleavage protein [Sinorhizobium medicae]MDX0677779.1 3-keto-5-aminohexanoate cleavage protein [Sinorhizobium medicae]MDX0720554.1 3-keto-5-aminohexanoate cleavage protein [Sinorhizobium medicae]MDX0904734.1 3-keto-5-aminohexanoate cleavage protein [Sinorhizobium medicae]MDX0998022.1 3-keto-5-aminohexanoate cleavage protein [Sinorhizobium medicae]